MENSPLVPISDSYSTPIYIVLPIITFYCAIFLNISNHYVLRPKIETFLEKVSSSSTIVIQIILDILSNLSFITYAASAFIFTPPSDRPFRVLEYYSSYWLTICLAIIFYLKVPNDMTISTIVLCKNGFILCLCYVNILYHYISGQQFVTLPAIFGALYILNLILNSYQQKFIESMLDLLNLKKPQVLKPKPKMISHLPSIEVLAKNYPVTRKQLDQHLQHERKQSLGKQSFHQNKNRKQPKTKIDTKLTAREKLLQICTCVHLSMMKREQQEKNAVRQYFGFMNGTINSNKLSGQHKPKIGMRHRKTYFNNRNKDKQALTRKSTKKIKQRPSSQALMKQNQNDATKDKLRVFERTLSEDKSPGDDQQQIISSNLMSQSVLFYLFPVKIFESSKIISTIFSIFINLGVGVLFNYSHNVMDTLKYGRFSDFVVAAMFIPVIPHVSSIQFTNTMALSSLLKFGICGIFACISVGINGSSNVNWDLTAYFEYNTIVQMVVLIVSFGMMALGRKSYKFLILAFVVSVGLNALICYFSISSNSR